MKKPYLVTYQFKGQAGTYTALFETLKSFGEWWHFIDGSWIVMTDQTAQQIYDRLKPTLDANINILIFELGHDRQGWLPQKAWDWIKRNIPKK